MSRNDRIGVIGGTFDPIHCGHVAVAREAQRVFDLSHVTLIPSRDPPHRPDPPRVSGYHRFAMTALATSAEPSWRVSDMELLRAGPSYTFDTLSEFEREGHRPSQIFFLLGSDAFAEIATWSRYPSVLDRAHFVVVARSGTTLASLRDRVPDVASRMIAPDRLEGAVSPRVILLEFTTPDISSTEIRARVESGKPIDGLVPTPVGTYIKAHRLYAHTPPVSSQTAGR